MPLNSLTPKNRPSGPGFYPALLLFRQRRPHVAHKSGMRRSAKLKILPRLAQAQLAIHRDANFSGVVGILAVIFPPADRAKLHRIRQRQRPRTAAGAAKWEIAHA